MRAAIDFSLCGRTPRSCSRHADCARAQFGTLNQDRQSFVWPKDTGSLCGLFHDFAPYRTLASLGGGIADSLAPDGAGANRETSPDGPANDGTASPETVQLSAGPNSGKLAAGSGEPGVASDTARHMPVLAGEKLAAPENQGQLTAVAESGDAAEPATYHPNKKPRPCKAEAQRNDKRQDIPMTTDEQPVKPADEAREIDLVLSIGTKDYLLDQRIEQLEAISIARILARGVRELNYREAPGPREIVALQLRPVAQAESEVEK